MPTARQTQANRRAAALSTGPNLPQGKTISITNGIPTAVGRETLSSHPTTISPPTTADRKNKN
jgi:hypothetical protein